MKFLSSLILVLTVSSAANALDYSMPAIEGGFKWNSIDVTGASSNKQTMGFQLGASAVFNFHQNFGLKSGLFYSERPFKADFAGSDVTGKFTYFEVPAHFMFKFEDYAGVYVGPSIAMNLSSEVSTGSLTDVKSMVIPITLGAQFKFLPNVGVNLFFETVSGDFAKDVKNSRAVGANLLFTLD